MKSGRVIARHYLCRRPFLLEWRRGLITRWECVAEGAEENLLIAPALFDPQVNGYAGVDFQQDGLTEADLLQAARAMRADGCTRFFLTLITDEWHRLTARLQRLAKIRARCPELRSAIAGWHIEGPFLSSAPGFCGAHDAALMRDPTPQLIRELRRLVPNDPLLLTLAPERPGSLAAIREAAALGIRVSLGHTDANAEQLAQAVAAGATGFTHLANGCPRELNRHDNILWRAFETSGLTFGLIPDGLHVSPAPFRLLHRLLPADRVYYTTDAMSAAASPPGEYRLGNLCLTVGEDAVVRLPGTPYFAGSALRPFQAIERASGMLGSPWTEIWPRCSIAPARFVGIPAGLAVGQPAHFCLLRDDPSSGIQILKVHQAVFHAM